MYINLIIRVKDISNVIFDYVNIKYELKIELKSGFSDFQITTKYANDNSDDYLFRHTYSYFTDTVCEYNKLYDPECDVDACKYVIDKIRGNIKYQHEIDKREAFYD